jgi:hypothetical protein
VPKPATMGGATAGPPSSCHNRRTSSPFSPALTRAVSVILPVGLASAPYLAALVASSLSPRASVSAKSGLSCRSRTSRRIRSLLARYGSSAVWTRDARLAQCQSSAIRALWATLSA